MIDNSARTDRILVPGRAGTGEESPMRGWDIAGYAEESGRSVIIVMNKWDLALEAAAEKAARELEAAAKKPHIAQARTRKHTSVVRKKTPTGKVNPAELMKEYEEILTDQELWNFKEEFGRIKGFLLLRNYSNFFLPIFYFKILINSEMLFSNIKF